MNGPMRAVTGAVSTVVEALEELRIHRGRVLLSLIGVAIAVCALTTVVGAGAIAEQANREVSERQSGRPATIQFNVGSEGGEAVDAATIDAAWASVLERYDIAYGSRNTYGSLTVQFAGGAAAVQVQAVDQTFGQMHRVRLLDGEWFGPRDADRLAPALIVNEVFWDRLGRPPVSTHPTVELLGEAPATGVITGVTPSQGEWDTEPTAFVLNDAYAAIAPATVPGMQQPPTYEMWVPDELADPLTEAVKRDLSAAVGEGGYAEGWRNDYGAWSEDPFLILKLLIVGIAVVILLLGALGLLNIALVTVRARIREIGIRRSFGATRSRVFFSVLMESVVGTFVAGIVGVAVSIALVQSPLMTLLLSGVELDDTPGFPIEAAVIGIVSATAVGALAGLLPALAAVRVRVIDAIRF
ncbi:ABC transporter permease [Agromyces albus]|uniref:ABC transporter permease n=1 Tax=Agromyces albus TaxID=205332 RepID=UPI002785A991|nr:ABC transporter permease [Agromyces albus]MDQ0574981.1 putative ABC transport system permease protein [Agromyces albus]